jgi:hypothetical protein
MEEDVVDQVPIGSKMPGLHACLLLRGQIVYKEKTFFTRRRYIWFDYFCVSKVF